MAVFRIEKTRDYTIMANRHLKNRSLSLKAKGLLSVILSLPDGWDYTLKGLARISKEGIDAIREAVRELEAAGYIVRSRTRNDKGQLGSAEYVIYEQPYEQPHPKTLPTAQTPAEPQMAPADADSAITPDEPAQEPTALASPALVPPTLDFPTQANPVQENPTQLNTKVLKTHQEKTDSIKSIHPSHPDRREMERCRARVEVQIDYDALLEDTSLNAVQLDEIVALMTETLCSGKETISVGGEDYPAEVVKSRLKKLNSDHIEYVLLCLQRTATPIRNIRKYLLTSLYNAPLTMDSFYTAEYNRHEQNRRNQLARSYGT